MALPGEVGHGYEAETDEDARIIAAFKVRDDATLMTIAKARGTTELVSPLMVCQSGAGFYIGTYSIHWDQDWQDQFPESGGWFVEPYSRESYDYYATEQAAQAALDNESWCPR